jgi:two-component system, chemotaxis family, chemotaxis protein CheY
MSHSIPSILVVDDIPAFRAILRDMLEEMGFSEIHEAQDGGTALELLNRVEIGLVVSDYMMSPQSGLDLLQGMQNCSRLRAVPFLLVSAVSEQQIVEQAMELGARHCFSKPLNFNTFKHQVLGIFASAMV